MAPPGPPAGDGKASVPPDGGESSVPITGEALVKTLLRLNGVAADGCEDSVYSGANEPTQQKVCGVNSDTSAGRLADILSRFVNTATGDNEPALKAWQLVFGMPNTFEVSRRLFELPHLYEQVVEQVKDLPDDEEPGYLLERITPIRSSFDRSMNISAQQTIHFKSLYTDSVVSSLRHCAFALRRKALRTPVVEERGIEQLLDEVRSWTVSISENDDLGVHDKSFILRRLREVHYALETFIIGGYDRLEDSVAALIGTGAMIEEKHRNGFLRNVAEFWNKVVSSAQGASAIASAGAQTAKSIETIADIISFPSTIPLQPTHTQWARVLPSR